MTSLLAWTRLEAPCCSPERSWGPTQTKGEAEAYLYVVGGGVTLNGMPLRAGDQARIADEPKLALTATLDAETTHRESGQRVCKS